ncbi:hypothetical protein TPHA_0J00210 [Tetrapisispora phaffii CBS 4417]|uniref:Phosphoinositide phospholipase C n=1 Tax=Tetrapisispora phaffii (strain ATCC 24235 / CBS 4417 / NBRC 1672 / NRRL Y-8282 / UCD 70-5) TaxID=1071381 RepID=G8BYA3_TETPH|nr:hypothetical protein TPHA_0J00210 [Tetrapisispora phaffii CBS 4417]CCE64845.1 hypothetical protein TPHA_0J00210 [Tetrapisispora phaffii CBS 4417]
MVVKFQNVQNENLDDMLGDFRNGEDETIYEGENMDIDNISGSCLGYSDTNVSSVGTSNISLTTLSKGLRNLARKTSDIVLLNNNNDDQSYVGPLTTPRAISIAFQYEPSNLLISNELSIECEKFRNGIPMMKITRNKSKMRTLRLNGLESITWKDGKKKMDIDTIKDIRIGNLARNYREEYEISNEFAKFWITVIYEVSNKLKALHVIANNSEDFNTVYACIRGLVKHRSEFMESMALPGNEKFAKVHWHSTVSFKREDEEVDVLSFEDVEKLCLKFHIYFPSSHLLKVFKAADLNNNGLLNFQEFQIFVKLLKKREEIDKLWKSITKDDGQYLDLRRFKHFLLNIQKENFTEEYINLLYSKLCNPTVTKITKANFLKYLSTAPYLKEIEEDYSKPINHYFIASSHNTYLLGKQYGETPSVEGYIQALQHGCRCVEIDIWDDESGPVVCHGFLTSAIPLINVVNVIRKYAFITSPYPLIISLEVNCNNQNQIKVASIFNEILGDSLVYENEFELGLLSPEKLKHKIIVKVKKTKNIQDIKDASTIEASNSHAGSFYDTDESLYEVERDTSSMQSSESMVSQSSSSSIKTRIKRLKMIRETEIHKELLGICGIHGLKFRNLSLPESKSLTHCFSFNEKKYLNLCTDESLKLSFNKHNRKYLTRVYPHAFRYKSSNFNPVFFWESGVQMVATNWQTNDYGQQLNKAFFQLSDEKNSQLHSGYKLKPPHLISIVSKTMEISHIPNDYKPKPLHIKLDIVSAQLLHKPKELYSKDVVLSPYVVVEFICEENCIDSLTSRNATILAKNKAQTNSCKGNGFNPIWESRLNALLHNSYFAFIKFTVKTSSVVLAECCLKLDTVKQGYRHIPLYNTKGEKFIFSTLFIRLYTT